MFPTDLVTKNGKNVNTLNINNKIIPETTCTE